MTRKLYALASGRCAAESVDSPSNQEILLGGHLYLTVLKVCVCCVLCMCACCVCVVRACAFSVCFEGRNLFLGTTGQFSAICEV